MCRTHVTQHELSAIAPDFEWAQLFASLGVAHIGATSADIVVGVARTRTRARLHTRADARCSMRCLHASACSP